MAVVSSLSFLDDLDTTDGEGLLGFEARMAAVRASIAAIGADLPSWPSLADSQAAEVIETMRADRNLSPPVFDRPGNDLDSLDSLDSLEASHDDPWGPPPVDEDLPDHTLPHWQQSREEAEGSLPLLPMLQFPPNYEPRQLSDLDSDSEKAEEAEAEETEEVEKAKETEETEPVAPAHTSSSSATEKARGRNNAWSREKQVEKRSRWLSCARYCAQDLIHRRHRGGKTKPDEGPAKQTGRKEQNQTKQTERTERTERTEDEPSVEPTPPQANKAVESDDDKTDDETYTERPLPNAILKSYWKDKKKPRYVLESSNKDSCIWKTINGLSCTIRYISPQKLRARHARKHLGHSK